MTPQTHGLDIWAAAATPFDPAGRLDLGVVADQAAHLTEAGVDGVLVAGTTGEFWALTLQERMSLLAAWAAHRGPELRLGIHVGHTCLEDALTLTRHAADHGVDLIASVAPYYGGPSDVESAVEWLAALAGAAPSTPLCYYHIPSWTGLDLDAVAVTALASTRVPTFAAVKYTDFDLMGFDAVGEAAPEATIYFGRDELLPAGIGFGVEHVIGSLYTFLAPVARQVWDLAAAGDHAAAHEAHRIFRDVARTCDANHGLPAIKSLSNRLAPDAGPTRSPLRAPDRSAAVLDELAELVRNRVAAATHAAVREIA